MLPSFSPLNIAAQVSPHLAYLCFFLSQLGSRTSTVWWTRQWAWELTVPCSSPWPGSNLFFSSLRLNPLNRSAARSRHIWTTVLDLFLLPTLPSDSDSALSAIVIGLLVSKQPQNEARLSICRLQGHGTFGLQCSTFFCCQQIPHTSIQLCQPLSFVSWPQNSLKMRPDSASCSQGRGAPGLNFDNLSCLLVEEGSF